MSDEPRTHKLDAQELLKFLDQLAPDVTEEQRAQLVFVDQRLQSVDASADPRASRTPHSHPFAQARVGQLKLANEPARDRPIELTMLDAERVLDAEQLGLRWSRRALRRGVLGGAAALALFTLLAVAAARSRDQHASVAKPPPLPQPVTARDGREARAPEAAAARANGGAHYPASALAVSPGAERGAPAQVDRTIAAEAPAPSSDDPPTRLGGRSGAPRTGSDDFSRGPAAAAPASVPALDDASSPTTRAGASEVGRTPEPGARRNAVDLLLAGESRAALDAYRALTRGGPVDPALAQVVRLLELELSTCGGGEASSCRP